LRENVIDAKIQSITNKENLQKKIEKINGGFKKFFKLKVVLDFWLRSVEIAPRCNVVKLRKITDSNDGCVDRKTEKNNSLYDCSCENNKIHIILFFKNNVIEND
jgi:antitoxin component YwqK of YwqJK toxin-antitoxin module